MGHVSTSKRQSIALPSAKLENIMTKSHLPQVVAALAAVVTTLVLFSSVASLADQDKAALSAAQTEDNRVGTGHRARATLIGGAPKLPISARPTCKAHPGTWGWPAFAADAIDDHEASGLSPGRRRAPLSLGRTIIVDAYQRRHPA